MLGSYPQSTYVYCLILLNSAIIILHLSKGYLMSTKRMFVSGILVSLFITAFLWVKLPIGYWTSFVLDFLFAAFLLFGWVFSSVTNKPKRTFMTLATLLVFWTILTYGVGPTLDLKVMIYRGSGASAETSNILGVMLLEVAAFVLSGWLVEILTHKFTPSKKK